MLTATFFYLFVLTFSGTALGASMYARPPTQRNWTNATTSSAWPSSRPGNRGIFPHSSAVWGQKYSLFVCLQAKEILSANASLQIPETRCLFSPAWLLVIHLRRRMRKFGNIRHSVFLRRWSRSVCLAISYFKCAKILGVILLKLLYGTWCGTP